MMTLAFKNTRQLTPAAAALTSLARCRDASHRSWYFVLAVVPRPAPQFSVPAIGRLDTSTHDRMEEEAERWDGLS